MTGGPSAAEKVSGAAAEWQPLERQANVRAPPGGGAECAAQICVHLLIACVRNCVRDGVQLMLRLAAGLREVQRVRCATGDRWMREQSRVRGISMNRSHGGVCSHGVHLRRNNSLC